MADDLPPAMEPVPIISFDDMRFYADGEQVDSNLPPDYASEYTEGNPDGQSCAGCAYFYMGLCHEFDATARAGYWCGEWEPYVEDDAGAPLKGLDGTAEESTDDPNKVVERRSAVYHLKTYSQKRDARRASERIGCDIGAHLSVDGRWSPCCSPSDLISAVKAKK